MAAGDYPAARQSFNRALALDSTLVNAYAGIARGLEAEGRMEEALAYYERGRRRAEAGEPVRHAEVSLLLKLGRYDEARRLAREGLGAAPGGAFLLSDLGLAFLRQGAADSAIVYFREALAADPSMLSARGNLAVAYSDKGLAAEAIEQYRIYLETAPPGQLRERAAQAIEELLTER
jgi:tetratricopeptide (TPR) repeat protein